MNELKRRRVWRRADDCCEYCRFRQDHEPFYRFHVEHIVAKQHGGGDRLSNLALACHHCNHHKGTNLAGIDPRTGKFVRLFDPRRQRWHGHFSLRDGRIVGRTQSGRATAAVLQMNAADRVELRKRLREADLFDVG